MTKADPKEWTDEHGYPTEAALEKIKTWPLEYASWPTLMEFIRSLWRYSEIGYFKRRGRTYWLSTGGWSGNESIIDALKDAHMGVLWMVFWQRSYRGGHYVFRLPPRYRCSKHGENITPIISGKTLRCAEHLIQGGGHCTGKITKVGYDYADYNVKELSRG